MSTAVKGRTNLLREVAEEARREQIAAQPPRRKPTPTAGEVLAIRSDKVFVLPPLDREATETQLAAWRSERDERSARLAADQAARPALRQAVQDRRAALLVAKDALERARAGHARALQPHVIRGVDVRAASAAEPLVAAAGRVVEQADEALAQAKTARRVVAKRRDHDARMIGYIDGQIRSTERRLAADARQAAVDQRSLLERGLDRARALVTGAA